MIALEQRMCPHPEVIDTELDTGETVLLQLESTMYYSLNATGTCIWQGLKRGHSLQEVSRQLQESFEVEAERADCSVLALVNELVQHQLILRLD